MPKIRKKTESPMMRYSFLYLKIRKKKIRRIERKREIKIKERGSSKKEAKKIPIMKQTKKLKKALELLICIC